MLKRVGIQSMNREEYLGDLEEKLSIVKNQVEQFYLKLEL